VSAKSVSDLARAAGGGQAASADSNLHFQYGRRAREARALPVHSDHCPVPQPSGVPCFREIEHRAASADVSDAVVGRDCMRVRQAEPFRDCTGNESARLHARDHLDAAGIDVCSRCSFLQGLRPKADRVAHQFFHADKIPAAQLEVAAGLPPGQVRRVADTANPGDRVRILALRDAVNRNGSRVRCRS
jgi:hypothetical protein